MKVLVTGANGLLGHHVVPELLSKGHSVRLLIRSERNIHFDRTGVETVIGGFGDESILNQALIGCDAVVHIAAMISHVETDYSVFHRINVNSTIALFEKSQFMGVKTFVFISTSNTVANGKGSMQGTEDSPIAFPFSDSMYAQSKWKTEQELLARLTLGSMKLIIINPCFIIGGFDTKPSSGKLMLMGYKKRILFIPSGGKNFVSADNVSQVICNALGKGRSGERYLVAGENMSFKDFFELQGSICNYQQWIIQLPNWVLRIGGMMGDLLHKLGVSTEFTTVNINQLLVQEYYSGAKAKSELALEDTNLRKSIEGAILWFKQQGVIS